jgi:hypothetical protein
MTRSHTALPTPSSCHPRASALRIVAASVLTLHLSARLGAQAAPIDTTERFRLEFGAGVTTQLPGFGDRGLGPVASLVLRNPGRSGRTGFVAGITYGLVPLRYRLPDGTRNNSGVQSLFVTLGPEFRVSDGARVDVQWNPALSREARWGTQPAWRGEPYQVFTLSGASAGLRLGKPDGRVGVQMRVHTSLHLFNIITGGVLQSAYPSLQVGLRT